MFDTDVSPRDIALAHARGLSDGSVRLALVSQADIEDIRCWRNHDSVRIWFRTKSILSRRDQQRWYTSYLQQENTIMFVARDVDSGCNIGALALFDITDTEAEIGPVLTAPKWQRRQVMTRSCRLLFSFCKKQLQLSTLYLHVFPENSAALNLYARLDFQKEQQTEDGLLKMSRSLEHWTE